MVLLFLSGQQTRAGDLGQPPYFTGKELEDLGG